MKYSLTIGALSDPPSRQIEDQLLHLKNACFHDADAKALARLHVRGILTDAEAFRARARLMKEIAKDVRATA